MPPEDANPAKVEREVEEDDEADEKMSLGAMLQKNKSAKIINNGNGKAKAVAREAKVKKEEQLEDDDFDKPTTKAKPQQEPRVKKEVKHNESDEEWASNAKRSSIAKPDKEIKKRTVKKMEEEETKKKKKGSAVATEQEKMEKKGPQATPEKEEKKEKKVYDLPGQKRDPPQERDPLRIFYETLYEQVPKSEMAQFWLMEYGLLSKEEAKRVFEKKQKRSQQQKLSSPVKAVASVKKSTVSVTVKKKTPSPQVPSNKKKSIVSKDAASNQCNKKRKNEDRSSESDSDDDFVSLSKKKSKAA